MRGFAGEEELLDAGVLAVHRTRLAVAQGAAHHRVPLVRGDDLQLARLAAEDLRGGDRAEEIALHEMARAAQADLFAESAEEPERAKTFASLHPPRRFSLAQRIQLDVRDPEPVEETVALRERPGIALPPFERSRRHRIEMGDEEHASRPARFAAGPAQQVDVDPLDHLPLDGQPGVRPERLQEVGRLPRPPGRTVSVAISLRATSSNPVEHGRSLCHGRCRGSTAWLASTRTKLTAEGSGAMNDPKATPFLTDIKELQRRAREHVEKGAVTPAYRGDVETAVKLLNEALATGIVCTLRYRRDPLVATGIHYQAVADEFMEHAKEEQEHADKIAERIRQLGGAPDFNPEGLLTRSHAQYAEGDSLVET